MELPLSIDITSTYERDRRSDHVLDREISKETIIIDQTLGIGERIKGNIRLHRLLLIHQAAVVLLIHLVIEEGITGGQGREIGGKEAQLHQGKIRVLQEGDQASGIAELI